MTRLGYQIPNFTYPDTAPAELFPSVVRQAREAEASGFDTVLVMDHFYQLPMLGPPENEMLECYTLLSALAQHTETGSPVRTRHGQHVPEPRLAREGSHHARPCLRWPRPARHRCRLVRARARQPRLRVRNLHGPLRTAGGSARDHHRHAGGRPADRARPVVHRGRSRQLTGATVENPTDDRRSAARRRRCVWWHNMPTSRT